MNIFVEQILELMEVYDMMYKGVTIKSAGICMPQKVLSNKFIEANADTTANWIVEKLGIEERRQVVNETVSDLGASAANKAILRSGLSATDIDLIVVATSSPERISPSTACTIHQKLGLSKNIPSFDLNAVCAGFVFAIQVCAPLITSGTYKNILIIGTETYSKITDWSHRNSVFFGDGAGAIILGESKKGWISSKIYSNGSGTGSTGFTCPINEKYKTNPKEVWEAAMTFLPNSIEEILQISKVSKEEIKMFFPHQASINMIQQICDKVGLPHKKIKKVMHKYGNIAGASIPIALEESITNGEIVHGDKILLTAIGSGWSWGSVVVNYEK